MVRQTRKISLDKERAFSVESDMGVCGAFQLLWCGRSIGRYRIKTQGNNLSETLLFAQLSSIREKYHQSTQSGRDKS